jgi:hypothetical protein
MNVTPKTVARQIVVARAEAARKPVFRSQTGVTRYSRPERGSVEAIAQCADVRKYGEHVLTYVEADLPGDRSVGTCICGKYIDTGTFDERNA